MNVMNSYPKNFDPAKYLGIDGGDPEEDEDPWFAWCCGQDARFPRDFARFCWWHFADALDTFVTWERLGGEWPHYLVGCGELAQARFRKELEFRFGQVQRAVGNALATQPFLFESLILTEFQGDEEEKKFLVQTACAYSIKCFDEGIFGLFENDSVKSAQAFSYALRALELAHEYRNAGTNGGVGELAKQLARSELARNAAIAKLQVDPKQSEKRFVFDCWSAWKNDPMKYKSKAAFARDMLEKCDALMSVQVIERWCREWESGSTTPAE